ncbi:MAG: hypothetical protein IKP95_10075 [Ruminococcus sp.]|nr:hypothetical protein [Ruminococcus sp.]
MNKPIISIRKLFNEKNRLRLTVALAVIAVLLIFLSEIIPGSSDKKKVNDSSSTSELSYKQNDLRETEERLGKLLSRIQGAGETSVILSLEGSEEYIYAEDITSERNADETETKEKFQSKLIVSNSSGNREGLIRKVLAPKYNGALVICEGGYDPSVRERLIKAVSAALDLPSSKICVEYSK